MTLNGEYIMELDNTWKRRDNKYNMEPVIYCAKCLSLDIRDIEGKDYCEKCGSTETKTTDIFTWMKLYRERYGRDFTFSEEDMEINN